MKIVGVIPARGGSKGIPLKNLQDFCGKPLIAWSILSAKASNLNKVIVSTDSQEIAEVAKKYGAEVPFIRPKKLALDTVGMEPVLKHAYEWLRDNDEYEADALMLLQSTSPLRQVFHIDEMIKIFKQSNIDSLVSVNETPANHTPYWTLIRNKEEKVTLFDGKPLRDMFTRRQDFPNKCYARNDLGYVLKPKNLYQSKPNLYGDNVELYITPNAHMYEIDINTQAEWAEAEEKARKTLFRI
ncbi:MAG: acylneuraminate cytidylyltransferase family protein [Minisyncoccota bacterium]